MHKRLPGTNTLAYLTEEELKSVYSIGRGQYYKTFFLVTYKGAK
jgi:hypothetical protein